MHLEQVLELLRNGAGLHTHSRDVRPGDVFLALPGARGSRTHGADYIRDAVSRGAVVIVHDLDQNERMPGPSGAEYVRVEKSAHSLGRLARAAFRTEESMPRVIGVTGTNGKTTTVYLVHHLLEQNGLCPGLMGTVQTTWPGVSMAATMTTPDCLTIHKTLAAMTQAGVQTVAMEISSHALDQDRLAGVPVEVGIFSNLTQDHLDYHGTMDAYFSAKKRLFLDSPHACALGAVNLNDPFGQRLLEMRPDLLSFGLEAPGARLRGQILEAGRDGMTLGMRFGSRHWELRTGLVGAYNASNLLAAQAAGLLLGLEPGQLECLGTSTGAPGRLQRVPNTRGLDIFIDYAHSPDALEKVSAALKSMKFARLITVFGCGGDRDTTKRPLMGQAAARYADVLVLTSDNPRTEDPDAILDQIEPGIPETARTLREADRRAAIARAISEMAPGDALLIAGKGHEDYQVVGTEKRHFSDYEVVQEILA